MYSLFSTEIIPLIILQSLLSILSSMNCTLVPCHSLAFYGMQDFIINFENLVWTLDIVLLVFTSYCKLSYFLFFEDISAVGDFLQIGLTNKNIIYFICIIDTIMTLNPVAFTIHQAIWYPVWNIIHSHHSSCICYFVHPHFLHTFQYLVVHLIFIDLFILFWTCFCYCGMTKRIDHNQ